MAYTLIDLAKEHAAASDAIKQLTADKKGLEINILDLLENPEGSFEEEAGDFIIKRNAGYVRKSIDKKLLDVLAKERFGKTDGSRLVEDATKESQTKGAFSIKRQTSAS